MDSTTNMRISIEHPARWFGTIFLLALVISYLGLAWTYQSLFLFDKVVHEDGKQTFLGLLFNSSHFLREIPISILCCVGVVGSYFYLTPSSDLAPQTSSFQNRGRLYWLLAGAIVLVAIFSTALSEGVSSVWHELAQYKTRGETLAYGSASGLGKGGTGTLSVDGEVVASKKMAYTLPTTVQWDEALDIGSDTLTGVNDADYKPPFKLTAKLETLTIKLNRPELSEADKKKLQEAMLKASD